MKKLMMGIVVCGAMALFGAQNAVSVKIAETYRGKADAINALGAGKAYAVVTDVRKFADDERAAKLVIDTTFR